MPMDESLFLVPAEDTAGDPVDNFCLGIIQVHEVRAYHRRVWAHQHKVQGVKVKTAVVLTWHPEPNPVVHCRPSNMCAVPKQCVPCCATLASKTALLGPAGSTVATCTWLGTLLKGI
jgi:hypothetical protein